MCCWRSWRRSRAMIDAEKIQISSLIIWVIQGGILVRQAVIRQRPSRFYPPLPPGEGWGEGELRETLLQLFVATAFAGSFNRIPARTASFPFKTSLFSSTISG